MLTQLLMEELNELRRRMGAQFSVLSFGAKGDGIEQDESPAFQRTLDACEKSGGGTVIAPRGTYLMKQIVRIPSNVYLDFSQRPYFKRNNESMNAFFINKSDGTIGGHNANQNIVIDGGIFDGDYSSFIESMSCIAIGHSQNFVIKNAEFKNIDKWHFIEINSSKDVFVTDCSFHDYFVKTGGSECIQIDAAIEAGVFPWFGPFSDNTFCENIYISKCRFKDGHTGIGTHSLIDKYTHRNINISDCSFENMAGACISGLNWSEFVFKNNHMYNIGQGIVMSQTTPIEGRFVIDGNIIRKTNLALTDGRGIYLKGTAAAYLHGGVITNNTVTEAAGHGIYVSYATYLNMSGNSTNYNFGAGCWLSGAKYVTVSGHISHNNNDAKNIYLSDFMVGAGSINDTQRVGVNSLHTGTLLISNATATSISDSYTAGEVKDTGTTTHYSNTWKGTVYVANA